MKTINVISPVYKNKVNFEGIVIDFNVEGKATVKIDEKDEEKFEKILKEYPNIFDADNLPNNYGKEEVVEEQVNEQAQQNSSQFETLRKSNIALAKKNVEFETKNAELEKENTLLKQENEALKAKIEELEKEQPDEEESDKKSEDVEDEGDSKEEKTEENKEIEKELNSKTVTELKGILNEVYSDCKEEWKSLTKKEDIVNYIKNKSNIN